MNIEHRVIATPPGEENKIIPLTEEEISEFRIEEELKRPEREAEKVIHNRATQYLPTGDQLDGILKALDSLRTQGYIFPDASNVVIDSWLEVKTRNPKEE